MANHISDETIEYVGILAKLELSEEEKEQAKKDMESMLDYIDKLNELDTSGVEPMSHVFPVNNVFREDVVANGDDRDNMLKNAPVKSNAVLPFMQNYGGRMRFIGGEHPGFTYQEKRGELMSGQDQIIVINEILERMKKEIIIY